VAIPLGIIGGTAKKDSVRDKLFSSLFLVALVIGFASLLVTIVQFVFFNLPSPNPCLGLENCDPSNEYP
jgi:hypothetical protein